MVQDRLISPFGLVRSGVAPDHPDTKARLLPSYDSLWWQKSKDRPPASRPCNPLPHHQLR